MTLKPCLALMILCYVRSIPRQSPRPSFGPFGMASDFVGPQPLQPSVPCLSMAMTQRRTQLCLEKTPMIQVDAWNSNDPTSTGHFWNFIHLFANCTLTLLLDNAAIDGNVFNKFRTSSVMRLQQLRKLCQPWLLWRQNQTQSSKSWAQRSQRPTETRTSRRL